MTHSYRHNEERGFVLIAVLVVIALSLLVAVGLVTAKQSEAMVQSAVKEQTDNYYKVEETMHKTVAWMQDNSKALVHAFLAANFLSNFDIGDPAVGDNEGANFSVPSLIKMKGTNNSVLLSNNSFFGTSAFPSVQNIDTSASFDAINAFENASLGDANVRVILMWARETAMSYEPIFRIDVITGNDPDRGVHSFTHAYGSLTSATGSAFFTSANTSLATSNNQCYSYQFTGSSKGAPRANCAFAADGNISTKAQINGSAYAKGSITLVNPSGEISGTTCEGNTSCHSEVMPSLLNWETVCSAAVTANGRGYVEVTSDQTWSSGSTANAKCWGDVKIKNNTSLTLNDSTNEYWFRSIEFQNNSNSRLLFANMPAGDTITVHTKFFANDKFNGNQWFNTNNAPHQVKLFIHGSNPITLNGTAEIWADITAPTTAFNILGNFNFYGGIRATSISATGNARLNADEAISGIGAVSDLKFSIRKASQRYRMY